MEVHHHSHTARKKWTHYFWEFFMLFLAVFCGFLAENQREHFVEHQREKKYMRSLFEDLKRDTATFRISSMLKTNTCRRIDSLILLLKSKSPANESSKIYFLARQILYSGGPRLTVNTKTFDQLKNSGNLRLIRNSEILDSISDYYYSAASGASAQDMVFQNQHDLFLSLHKLFDAGTFQQMMDTVEIFTVHEPLIKPPLLTNDPVVINEICTRYHFTYGTHRVIMNENSRLAQRAITLMNALQKEYHFN